MKLSAQQALAAGLLAIACGSASAQIPVPSTGNGGVFLSAWDEARGISVVQYLNVRLNDVGTGALTPSGGLVLPFSPVDLAPFGGNLTNVRYNVSGGDIDGFVPTEWRMVITGAQSQTTAGVSLTNDGLFNSLTNLENFVSTLNANCVSFPCVATTASSPNYAGGPLHSRSGGIPPNLPWDTTTLVGTALSFWSLASQTEFGFEEATMTQYANATGFGRWLLGLDGSLTYQIDGATTVVPLPAAAWLLLSGLAGFGVISRRRRTA